MTVGSFPHLVAALPQNVVELGAGFGGFGYLMVKEGLRRIRAGIGAIPEFRFVFTDHISLKHVEDVLRHPKLRELMEETEFVDYAFFDIGKSRNIHLARSGETLQPSDPIVFISHSVMAELPFDFFKIDVEGNRTFNTHVSLSIGRDEFDEEQCRRLFNVGQRGTADLRTKYVETTSSKMPYVRSVLPDSQLRSGFVQVPYSAAEGFASLAKTFTHQLLLIYDEVENPKASVHSMPLESRINFGHTSYFSVPINIKVVLAAMKRAGMRVVAKRGHPRAKWQD